MRLVCQIWLDNNNYGVIVAEHSPVTTGVCTNEYVQGFAAARRS